MKNNKLTIGQMAKLNKTTVPTLRLYERLGLLVPAYINPDNGYRYYDITQSVVFRAIQYNTNLTVSLKELQTVIEHHDYHLVKQIYENKLQDVKSEIKALTAKKHMLYKTINWLEHYRQMPRQEHSLWNSFRPSMSIHCLSPGIISMRILEAMYTAY